MLSGKKLNPVEKLAYRLLSLTAGENITLRKYVKEFAGGVPDGARVLDAGDGLKPYAEFFAHCQYESCDFAEVEEFYGNLDDGRRDNLRDRHTYVCPLDNIPVPDNS